MAKSNARGAVQRREGWQDLLRLWRASGLSQAEFCRRRGIPGWKLAWWKRRLDAKGMAPEAPFVPAGMVAPPPAGELELTLRGGHVLRFGGDVDAGKLAGIVAALERIPAGAAVAGACGGARRC